MAHTGKPGGEKRERILKMLAFEQPDRVPLLGGWVLGDRQHQALAGCSEEEYWRDPLRWAIEAERALGVDGMIAVLAPRNPGEYRDAQLFTKTHLEEVKQRFRTPEDVLAHARSLPGPAEAVRRFDAEKWKAELAANIRGLQRQLADIVYLPTLWEVVHPKFEWYWDFGYENYLLFVQLYPEAAYEFFAVDAAVARRRAELVVQLYRELNLVPLTLIGTDICGANGPVISPQRLRECYFPHVRYTLEPLRDAGIRTVWHSDGDFRLIIDDVLSCGVSGFQGFQEEYGIQLNELAQRRTLDGERLVVFAGPSVSSTLTLGTVEEVQRDVERIIRTLSGKCALFILPANNILPDCPVENIIALYEHAAQFSAEWLRRHGRRRHENLTELTRIGTSATRGG